MRIEYIIERHGGGRMCGTVDYADTGERRAFAALVLKELADFSTITTKRQASVVPLRERVMGRLAALGVV
jgi:hypothetical protein